MDRIVVDVGHLLADGGGEHFISTQELPRLVERHRDAYERLRESLRSGTSPITRPFQAEGAAANAARIAAGLRKRYESVLLIGIGGSTLGYKAAVQFVKGPLQALLARAKGLPAIYAVDNVDPTMAAQLDELLDMSKTAIVYVSKSGSTPESAANFLHFYDTYAAAGGRNEDIVIIADSGENGINRIARRLGCHLLHIPSDLGGRYSVLSPAGLVPCELAGISGEEMLAGAAAMNAAIISGEAEQSGLLALAACLAELAGRGKLMHVLFTYGSRLSDFGLWFAQLWAESLGKRLSRAGDLVHAGTTPLPAVGATDQHSVLQLFKEGPNDKVFGFVTVRDVPEPVTLPSAFAEEKEYAYFAGHTLAEQLAIEQVSTEVALVSAERPCYRIVLPEATPSVLGGLFYFMEALVILMGDLWQVNPFDQPGVEQGKRMTYTLMGREDYAAGRAASEEELRVFESTRRVFSM